MPVLDSPSRRLLDPMMSPRESPPSTPLADPLLEDLLPPGRGSAGAGGATLAVNTAPREVLRAPEAGLFDSWCVLTNTLLGVGLLGLPWAVSTVGLGLGVVMLLGAGGVGALALHFLSHVAIQLTGGDQGPAEVTFYGAAMAGAPAARYVVDVAIAVKCFGVATSYLQVIGQLGASLLQEEPWTSQMAGASGLDFEGLRRRVILLVLIFVIAPTVFHKRITKTASKNFVAIVAWLYMTSLVSAYSLGLLAVPDAEAVRPGQEWEVAPPSTVTPAVVASTLPIFIFSFTCHQNLFPIANELKGRSLRRLDLVVLAAVGTSILLYGLVGFGGYIRFGRDLKANFMLNLPRTPLVKFGEASVTLAVIFTYPLQLHPCRRSLMILVSSCLGRFLDRTEERWCRRVLTTIILAGTACLAFLVRDLGITLAFVGAVGSNTVVLIMPAFLFMRMPNARRGPLWYAALLVFITGCIILPTSLTAVVMKALGETAA